MGKAFFYNRNLKRAILSNRETFGKILSGHAMCEYLGRTGNLFLFFIVGNGEIFSGKPPKYNDVQWRHESQFKSLVFISIQGCCSVVIITRLWRLLSCMVFSL